LFLLNLLQVNVPPTSLTSLDLSSFDTAAVTTMYAMFHANSLTSLNLSNFNTAKVTNMGYMFYHASGLTSLDLSSFDTAAVTNMDSMFQNATNLTSLDATGWQDVTTNPATGVDIFLNKNASLTVSCNQPLGSLFTELCH
jgi:surface protein